MLISWTVCPVIVADLSGDGNLDIATLDEKNGQILLLVNNGGGTFQPTQEYAVGAMPVSIAAADLNGDGRLDLIGGNRVTHDISVLMSNTSGTFDPQERIAGGQEPQPAALFDLNGDNRVEQVTADDNTNGLTILMGIEGGFIAADQISTKVAATPILADLNGDGAEDVVQVNVRGDILARLARPDTPGAFSPPQVVNPGRQARDVAAVATPGGIRLAALDQAGGTISLYAFSAGGWFASERIQFPASLPTRIEAGDLNRDGCDDLVVIDGAHQSLSVFLSAGADNPWLSPFSLQLGGVPGALALVDAGSTGAGADGSLDLVVADEAAGDVRIMFNDGAGHFAVECGLRLRASTGRYGICQSPEDGSWYSARRPLRCRSSALAQAESL
jgi:hypothetical protein